MTTDQITTETTPDAPERFWWATDYARAAQMLHTARHAKCQSYTPASPAKQAAVDDMAAYMAAVFTADAPGDFDPEKFMAGTYPYAAPVAVADETDTDTDDTDDETDTDEADE